MKVQKLTKLYRLELEEITNYATRGAAGIDLACADHGGVRIYSSTPTLISTGIAVEIPPGMFGLIRPRSSLCTKYNLGMLSSGIIDEDYRGQIFVNIFNFSSEHVDIFEGQRIAQMVVLPYHKVKLEWVSELPSTERGSGGHGSTGI